jgi:hypothetical protein
MPPAAEDEIVSIPGFPQSDEEERAIGMRRPAYIPATEEKRKRKLSSWRVVSGVLSIMVICVAACAGVGFLGKQEIANLLPGPIKNVVKPPSVDLSQVPATPVATPGPAAKNITSIVTAEGVDANGTPINVTSFFHVGATVYIVIRAQTSSQVNTVTCVYYLNGINYQLHQNTVGTIPATKAVTPYIVKCALPYLQPGVGMVRVYWNRPDSDTSESESDPYLAQTIKFAVLNQLPGTTTPGTGTPGSGTASPHAAAPITAPEVTWREPRSGEG